MKAKRDKKKLNLSAETLHRLTDVAVVEIAGGISSACSHNCTTSQDCTDSCGPLSVCICR